MFLFRTPTNTCDKYLNCISRYHLYVFSILFFTKTFILWHVLNNIFLAPSKVYFACGDEGVTSPNNHCPCETYTWHLGPYSEVMQSYYKLTCKNLKLAQVQGSLMYLGMLIGALVWGMIADRFGRLRTYAVTWIIVGVSGTLVATSPNLMMYCVCRFLEGFGIGGAIVVSYVLCVEYCGTKYRELVSVLFHFPLNVGHITITGLSYILRNFRSFQLAASLPLISFCSVYILLKESPRWLLDKNKTAECAEILKKIHPKSRANFKSELDYYVYFGKSEQKKYKVWEIFRYRSLTINFFCMGFNYMVCGMGYYGVSQYVANMNDKVHLNAAIGGFLTLPGTAATAIFISKVSRKYFLIVTNMLSGISMLIVIMLPSSMPSVKIGVAACCNSFFWMSFIIIFLYGVELFPTCIRNSVLGCLSVLSRLGQIVIPWIDNLDDKISGAVYGLSAIIGAVLVLFLPDTKDKPLPSTLQEIANLTPQKKKTPKK